MPSEPRITEASEQTHERHPLVEIPAELLAEMRERVWLHTASLFVVERSTPVYKGPATCVAVAKKEYLLTAAHVWRELRADRFALSLEADRLLVPIQTRLVEPTVLSGWSSESGARSGADPHS